MSDMRKYYLDFISMLSEVWSPYFGNVWWYSLVHEKNTTKSRTFHDLIKGLQPKNKFVVLKSFYWAIKKYLVFIFRYFYFSFNTQNHFIPNRNLFIVYGDGFLDELYDNMKSYTVLTIPQRYNWDKILKDTAIDEISVKDTAIDRWLRVSDFLVVFLCYLKILFKFMIMFFMIKKSFGKIYKYSKMDVWRSFAGDVLVEGLFFERIFKNIASNCSRVERVIYVYEGQHWEKALCLAFDGKAKRIGIICSAPSINILNYHYNPDEVKLMPKPDYLGVSGQIPFDIMTDTYGDRVFILGAVRFNVLMRLMELEKISEDHVLILLGVNKEQNRELIDYCVSKQCVFENTLVKRHPNGIVDDYGPYKYYEHVSIGLGYLLRKSERVIASSSTSVFYALALGVPVTIPELKSFVNMSPLCDTYRVENDSAEYLKNYFIFNLPEEKIILLEAL